MVLLFSCTIVQVLIVKNNDLTGILIYLQIEQEVNDSNCRALNASTAVYGINHHVVGRIFTHE